MFPRQRIRSKQSVMVMPGSDGFLACIRVTLPLTAGSLIPQILNQCQSRPTLCLHLVPWSCLAPLQLNAGNNAFCLDRTRILYFSTCLWKLAPASGYLATTLSISSVVTVTDVAWARCKDISSSSAPTCFGSSLSDPMISWMCV